MPRQRLLARLGKRLSARGVGRRGLLLPGALAAGIALGGCGDHVRPAPAGKLAEFGMIGPAGPAIDMDRLARARLPTGPYRVVPEDVLELQIPRMVDQQMPENAGTVHGNQVYECRVSDEGSIVLPIIGSFPVAGRSLSEIDQAVMAQYYPKYIKKPLPVHVTVSEYSTRRVSIVGAVTKPGVYALRHDQMSLVALLMEAGGIVPNGASIIRIVRPARNNPEVSPMPLAPQAHLARAVPAVRTTGWEDNTLGRDAPDAGADRTRAIFQRDPSSRTIGWLSLVEGSRVLMQNHLDVSSEEQRANFLKAAMTRMDAARVRDLHLRLISLSGELQMAPPVSGPGRQRSSETWRMVNGWYFETPLGASAPVGRGPAEDTAGRGTRADMPETETTSVLPIRGLNIPFADVALEEGDSIVVEHPVEQFISVIGLVNRPGNMPYPREAQYNLVQAIAFAGGLDLIADPRYVSVYRLRPDGTIGAVTVQLVNPQSDPDLTNVLAMPIRPGDVVSVEHTPRTRTNVFFDRIFRVSLGLYVNPESLWEDD